MMALLGQSIPISFSKTSFNTLYVNGKYIESNSTDTLSLLNPKDSTLVAEKIPIADKVDVDAAVKYAEAAFNGPWATFTSSQRSECFRKLADILETRLPDILHLDSLTTGNPISLIPTREKNYIKNCLLYYGMFFS
jgi:aldehyde dehydrogenase (NAD+)/retinal dehydrogenase